MADYRLNFKFYFLQEVKRSGGETNHPSPYSGKINKWSYTSINILLNGTHSGGVWGLRRKEMACTSASEV